MTEFITRNYGQKEFEVIIKTDNKDHYKATEDFARKLIDHAKPQTNADRIRAMSDELLASQLVIVIEETIKALTDLDVPDEILNEVRSQLLERLKQPAEK